MGTSLWHVLASIGFSMVFKVFFNICAICDICVTKKEKTMEANIENLKEAMRRCAEAHKAEFFDWEDISDQLCIGTSCVPVIMDVRMICEAFYGTFSPFDAEDGYTLIHLGMPFLPTVNEYMLNMALPANMAMAA